METAAVWSLFHAPWWKAGVAVGLVAAVATAALVLLLGARRRAVRSAALRDDDSTWGDDDAATGFRSSRFAARVCAACSQPMWLENDGRWRCAAHPVCRS